MAQSIKTRVLIVDDHALLRQCLRTILEHHLDVEVVGEASDGNEALLCVAKLRPAVVIMDINMSRMDGITTTHLIKTQYPDIVVIGLSFERKDDELHAMQKAGGSCLLLKENAVTDLYIAIQRAVAEVNVAVNRTLTLPRPARETP